MNNERYNFSNSEDHKDYIFDSIGPNGEIRKVVRYSLYELDGVEYYNLGFGDLNLETMEVDDLSISANKDRDKVLATVANTVLDFISHFPDALIAATGSTPARTRLYQMAIAANFDDINSFLHVLGYKDGRWHVFLANGNYERFLVLRRK